jgi:hypothetical protein
VLFCAEDRNDAPAFVPPDAGRGFDIVVLGCRREGKWPAVARWLQQHRALWQPLRYVWIPDADVRADAAAVRALCALMREHGLMLAQPAQAWDAPFDEVVSLQHAGFRWRAVNHVGVAMPCFRTDHLAAMLPTLALADATAVGFLWAGEVPVGQAAVLDSVVVQRQAAAATAEPSAPVAPSRALLQHMAERGITDLRAFNWGGIDETGQALSLFDATRDAFLGRLLGALAAQVSDPLPLGSAYAMHLARSREGRPELPPASAAGMAVTAGPRPARGLRRSPITTGA